MKLFCLRATDLLWLHFYGNDKDFTCLGDERVNEAPSLSGLHVVFLRLHNMIARGIRKETKYSSQEVFLETKKIVGAIIQQVTYGEYLPVLLGKKIRKNLGLDLQSRGYWRGYDPNVNPTVKNVIATAALRYGHSQVRTICVIISHLPFVTFWGLNNDRKWNPNYTS